MKAKRINFRQPIKVPINNILSVHLYTPVLALTKKMKAATVIFLIIFSLAANFVAGGALCGCPPTYDPVCASNHQTYRNKCEMGCDQYHSGLYILWHGQCSSPPSPVISDQAPLVTPIQNEPVQPQYG